MSPSVILKQGLKFGVWKLDKVLGRGGQGEVWRVRASRQPPRAMKVCTAIDEREQKRFEQEIALLEQHGDGVHVVRVLDSKVQWAEGYAYFVMELGLESRERALWFRDTLVAVKGLRQALVGLQYLHDRGVWHRDIKPDNLLLVEENRRFLWSDLGVGTPHVAGLALTQTNEVVGSQGYRAPEILQGHGASTASEVYSMGRVLQTILCESLDSWRVSEWRGFEADASAAVEAVIRKATASDPSARFRNMQHLLTALPSLSIGLSSAVHGASTASEDGLADDVGNLVPFSLQQEIGRIDLLRGSPIPVKWKPHTHLYGLIHVTPTVPTQLSALGVKQAFDNAKTLWPPAAQHPPSGTSTNGSQGRAKVSGVGTEGEQSVPSLTLLRPRPQAALIGLAGDIAWQELAGSVELHATRFGDTFRLMLRDYLQFISAELPAWKMLRCTLAIMNAEESTLFLGEPATMHGRRGTDIPERCSEHSVAHQFRITSGDLDQASAHVETFLDRVWAAYAVDRNSWENGR